MWKRLIHWTVSQATLLRLAAECTHSTQDHATEKARAEQAVRVHRAQDLSFTLL